MQCRSCHNKNLEPIISLGNQYLSDFRDDDEKPSKHRLDLMMCKACTLVQLKETTPSNLLYNNNYGYKSGINNTIKADLKEIVSRVTQLFSNGIVVDIGANDGTLLSNYDVDKFFCVGFEPVPKLAKECEDHADLVINDFFSYDAWTKLMKDKKADVITAVSMFYDLDDPNAFVSDLKKLLAPDGVIIIQQNYLVGMLQQNAFDNVVHEHVEYYTLKSLEHLLNRHGLEVFDVETNSINGGSFRTYIKHMDRVKQMRFDESELKLYQEKVYVNWAKKIREIKQKTYDFIKKVTKDGATVYLYGASTRGNSLIQYLGLDNTMITAAVERNPEKWGKKIASLQIPIISEEQARKDKPDYMLVLPWFFKTEFLQREKKYLLEGGHFIFALPDFEVI